jgi:hypothetical protein
MILQHIGAHLKGTTRTLSSTRIGTEARDFEMRYVNWTAGGFQMWQSLHRGY